VRETIAARVRTALTLSSDREANFVVNTVTDSIVAEITANIELDGFTLKLPRFGKFEVRHKQGKMRKIPLTGKVQMTADKRKVKFIPLAAGSSSSTCPAASSVRSRSRQRIKAPVTIPLFFAEEL
jgi:nucleoid DNA-binding protein